MLKILLAITTITTVLPVNAQVIYSGKDNSPIGVVSKSEYQANSISNEYGAGSEYRADSICNKFGTNGSEYSQYGAYNPYAKAPPYVISGRTIYFVTVKQTNYPYVIHPDLLKEWCYK